VSVVLEPGVVERLRLARFELEDGRSELAALTDVGAYKAIKSFHDALETFLDWRGAAPKDSTGPSGICTSTQRSSGLPPLWRSNTQPL